MKIKSKHSMFEGEEFEKPEKASIIYGPTGEPFYTCPYCKQTATEDDCDCIGAEPNCLFCNHCGGEFET